MLTLRQRVFFIVSAVLGVFLAILLYLLYGRQYVAEKKIAQQAETNTAAVTSTVPIQATAPTETITLPEYNDEMYVKQLARIFVERFATYSTQNPNQNITDSLELASPTMQTWMKSQLKEPTREYEGALTEVLASRVTEKIDTAATVAIEVQETFEQKKEGAVGANTKEIRQKKGRVTLIKVGGTWKIDGLFWENA